ncbi:MAG: hypothetical protein J6L62_05490 [Clostridia bacterium]|nr:hypothetical protein [Clostridia bacterium]
MTKTFSKLLAVVLSVCMLFAVAVTASAEEAATFAVNGSLTSVTGNWDDDYAETITIKIDGNIKGFAEDATVTVGTGSDVSNLFTFSFDDIGYSLTPSGGDASVSVPFNNYVSHAETYNFYFAEGTFVDVDGNLSEELTVTVTGNDIIEELDVEHISVRPIEKLIDWMYTWGAEGFWLDVIDFIVSILEWFLYI